MPEHPVRPLGCAIAALVAVSLPSSLGAQPQPAAGALTRDGSHDMDFARGDWRTDIVQVKNPFDPGSPVTHMHGTKTVTPIWGREGLARADRGRRARRPLGGAQCRPLRSRDSPVEQLLCRQF